jgi:hypothetical protein
LRPLTSVQIARTSPSPLPFHVSNICLVAPPASSSSHIHPLPPPSLLRVDLKMARFLALMASSAVATAAAEVDFSQFRSWVDVNAERMEYPAIEGKNPDCSLVTPHTVVRPQSTADVVEAVRAANELGLPLCVKSGGHSYTCNHVQPNCYQIDLREMNSAKIITEAASEDGMEDAYFLEFGTGALTQDLINVAPESDWTFVHGECYTVGVGGFFLHGGVHLGYGTALYGLGGQNVVEMDMVLANSTVLTVTDPTMLGYLTRAGSSFGVATRLKLKLYKRPSPHDWIIPVLPRATWRVDEAMDVYRKVWRVKREYLREFQVNFWLQANGATAPSLQISYLGLGLNRDAQLDRCAQFIRETMGIPVDDAAVESARAMEIVFNDFGIGYHIKIPPHVVVPRWEAEPYVTSNFIVEEEMSYEIIKPYVDLAFNNKTARCLLLLNVMFIPNTPYPGEGFAVALDHTCFGEFQPLATGMTKVLMEQNPMGATDVDYWKYYNLPTVEEDKCRYWPEYAELMKLKMELDPGNRFDVFQGIHSSDMSVHNDGDCPF